MSITDNGKGFDSSNARSGNGLTTMYERAKILRGVFDIESALHKGTTIKLSFPIEEDDFDKLPEEVVKEPKKESNFNFQMSKTLNFWSVKIASKLAYFF